MNNYPKVKDVDAVLEKLEDDTWVPEGEHSYDSEAEEIEKIDSEDSSDEENIGKADAEAFSAVAGIEPEDAAVAEFVADDTVVADAAMKSANLISAYKQAIESMKYLGAQSTVVHLENEIRKERRRTRSLANENPDVVYALERIRGAENMRECKRRLLVQENKKKLALSADLNAKLKEVNKTLKEKERELQEKESLIEAKYAINIFTGGIRQWSKKWRDCPASQESFRRVESTSSSWRFVARSAK